VTRVSAGGSHVCAVMAGGTIRRWGRDDYGQLGYGDAYAGEDFPGDDEPSSLCEVPVM
jgi:alpha-tubulin suppressor-like RCC1 family protein